jgi:hypothetical protein
MLLKASPSLHGVLTKIVRKSGKDKRKIQGQGCLESNGS